MINIAERILVPHPPSVVWSVLSDPERVIACIEGSRIGDRHEDGSFDTDLTVRFAGIKVTFKAIFTLALDEAALTGRIDGRGGDGRGSTRVQGAADFTIVPDAGGSVVTLNGSGEVKGTLAGLVTTGASHVVDRMAKSFTTRLIAACAEFDPAQKRGE